MSAGPSEEDVRSWDEHQAAHGHLTTEQIARGLALRQDAVGDEHAEEPGDDRTGGFDGEVR